MKMNHSFENIFEKFNLKRETPRKRLRTSKSPSINFHKKSLPITAKIGADDGKLHSVPHTKNLNLSYSCYLNNHSKAKYNIPTRYSRLELIEAGSERKLSNCSITEYSALDENGYKCLNTENGAKFPSLLEIKASNERKICDPFGQGVLQNTKPALLSVENIRNNLKQNNITSDNLKLFDTKLQTKDSVYDLLITENSLSKRSDSENITTQNTQNGSSELDLLIELIEQEEHIITKEHTIRQQNAKISNCDERLVITKPRLKGGYQEMFEHALKHAKAKSHFLKYDKKIGLRIGHQFTVVKIETFHGLTIATVKYQDLQKNFAVVVAKEMVRCLKLGSQIEAFFDDNTLPYKLLLNGEYFEVYLEPYKLISH